MRRGRNSRLAWAGRLAMFALALGACAAPATPNDFPPRPATSTVLPSTATAIPPTTASTAESTAAVPSDAAVPATSAALFGPNDLAFDTDGNMYVSECGYFTTKVLKIDLLGLLTVYAGGDADGFSGDGGPARSAELSCPSGLALDRDGNLYVADSNNARIRRIDRGGMINTVAGSETYGFGGDGGAATVAQLLNPADLIFDLGDNLYLVDANNNRVRKVDRQGIITTVAGTGEQGFSGDGGPATAAELNVQDAWEGLAFDADGNLYIADANNLRVRKVDKQGVITTIAGNGGAVISGDGGPATAATLSQPTGLAFDADGNLFVACAFSPTIFDSRVRKIDKRGIITTVVGAGTPGFSGDGGPAVSATIKYPIGIAFDRQGNLYIADNGNARVRKVDQNGIITTVAGGRP